MAEEKNNEEVLRRRSDIPPADPAQPQPVPVERKRISEETGGYHSQLVVWAVAAIVIGIIVLFVYANLV